MTMEEIQIKEYYEKNPEGIPPLESIPEIYEMHSILKERVKKYKPDKLLDAGCGKGYTGESIYKLCKQYYGLDFSSSAIKIAKSRVPKGKFWEGSLRKLPFKDKFFDLIVCSEVLEHIPLYNEAIKEISRVIKKGGTILITTPNRINPDMVWRRFWKGKYTYQIYDVPVHYKDLMKKFKENRLKIEEFFSFFYLPLFGGSIPPPVKKWLMKIQEIVSKITRRPLGLYLFFRLTKV